MHKPDQSMLNGGHRDPFYGLTLVERRVVSALLRAGYEVVSTPDFRRYVQKAT